MEKQTLGEKTAEIIYRRKLEQTSRSNKKR